MSRPYATTAYRYPSEPGILGFTLLLVFIVIAITSAATVCGSLLFVIFMLVMAYFSTKSHHNDLIEKSQAVTPQSLPGLATVIQTCAARLQVESMQTFIVPSRALNAYTFGLSSPKAIVVYSPLLQLMDAAELAFIIGHEMGHVRLGHTVLNSLVGGMAGIPSNFLASTVMRFAFLWWNRACEYSADRAGLLACGGQLDKAISALVRLATGTHSRSAEAMHAAYQRVDAEDDDIGGNLSELLTDHPLIINRIEELQKWVKTSEYQRMLAGVNGNIVNG